MNEDINVEKKKKKKKQTASTQCKNISLCVSKWMISCSPDERQISPSVV